MTAMDDAERMRERQIRARNRALFAVLAALAVLLYAITLVRIGG
ncbi:MAG TPA: hypothetical protein VMS01_05540 [Stellaceae bacterium]|jgi:hypothetical protein|nr:hypothetical protein [Stellaceae bacterium]